MTMFSPFAPVIEKIPEVALPCAIGVSETVHNTPESDEWKTREVGPPVPKNISLSKSRRHVLLAAKAPSPGTAAGMLSLGSIFQCSPSVVVTNRNFSWIGSPSARQCVSERQAIVSRKNSLRLSVYCNFQVLPPSVVL